MLRNKEFQLLMLVLLLIDIVAFIIAAIMTPKTMWFIIGLIVVFNSIIIFFTLWRYKELKKLAQYLRHISSGNYTLDVRDNNEGELSILRNEIFKVTTILSEHGSLLQADKVQLTNAISDISHQLKTPLTSMTVMTDLLHDPHLPTIKRTEFTQNIQVQLERLDWLVTSLLKLSKIDAGTVDFKKEDVNVRRLIEHSLEPLMIPFDIKEQIVLIEGKDNVTLTGDFEWTSEALINILKNCVEHTREKGQLTITYEHNVLYTEINIQDEGGGISKADLPYIFKRFYKGEKASGDSVGIGLAMAYTIITKQGGNIEVEIEEGVGSTFRITFYHRHDLK